jgi:hypothetical protein
MTAPALVLAVLELAGDPREPARRRALEVIAYAIAREASRAGLDPLLFAAVGVHESNLRMEARGARGEVGAWQLLPEGTAARLCKGMAVDRLRGNARCAARVLAYSRRRCGPDPAVYLSHYNGRGCRRSRYSAAVIKRLEAINEPG